MKKETILGFVYGIISSATFGLIPLFTLPVIAEGMKFPSILLYRFFFACIILFTILLIKKTSLKIRLKEIPALILLGIMYNVSSIFLFWGYQLMSSGVATTIHFMYPVFTAIIMMLFFKERSSKWRFFAIVLAIIGVSFLTLSSSSETQITMKGIFIVLLSAVGYGSYIVAVNHLNLKMSAVKLTFYVFLFGGTMLFIGTQSVSTVQTIPSYKAVASLFLLALIPTTLSNLALIQAVKRIGSTVTSVLGAMEPVTAIVVGIICFHEVFTTEIAIGITLIITAVIIIILKNK